MSCLTGAPRGSSPPVRGTLQARKPRDEICRFIPACAGNTRGDRQEVAGGSVHPRLCGEHFPQSSQPGAPSGSSPPVRGTLHVQLKGLFGHRFIPACAGNTRRTALGSCFPTVHPRLCGEHYGKSCTKVTLSGSSPPVRGTPAADDRRPDFVRFIPACAGNTAS